MRINGADCGNCYPRVASAYNHKRSPCAYSPRLGQYWQKMPFDRQKQNTGKNTPERLLTVTRMAGLGGNNGTAIDTALPRHQLVGLPIDPEAIAWKIK